MELSYHEIPIEALCTRVTSGSTPLRSRTDYYKNGTIDWFKTGELNDWFVESSFEKVTPLALQETSLKIFPAGTVLMAMYGDGKTITTLSMLRKPATTNQACAAMLVDKHKCDPIYFFYALKSRRNKLIGLALGGAQRNLSAKVIKNFCLPVFPMHTQRRIANVLSAYDELVENNQRRIRILEEIASSLYREWFVHFRYPGHESIPFFNSPLGPIPKGWEIRSLKDIATVTYGYALKSKNFNSAGTGLPVVRIRDIPTGATETFTDEICDAKYEIKNGHILVGMDGDFHMCIWSSGLALQNQRVARFESLGELSNYHLFLALEKPIQEFNKAIVGTTVAHLGDMHIKTIQIVWPPKALREKAKGILEPLSKQVITLKQQTVNLRQTRDLLLPRLLSGQINLPDNELNS